LQVPPPLDMVSGRLIDATTQAPTELHGLNFFGWETGTFNFDGLW
jgi:hypothetical protein